MVTIAALWTKHRPIAYAIAAEYRIPNQDPEDTAQDALVALWEACGAYDRAKGPFPPFARLVVHRRLTDRLRAETRRLPTVELEDVAAPEDADAHTLTLILTALPSLSDFERSSLARTLNGEPMTPQASRAANRARHKLRAA